MSSHRHPIDYTCDVCGSGPWSNAEVATVQVTFKRPTAWEDTNTSQALGMWHGEVCRACLGTQRVGNPAAEYENTVHIDYNDIHNDTPALPVRFLRWLFPKEATDA